MSIDILRNIVSEWDRRTKLAAEGAERDQQTIAKLQGEVRDLEARLLRIEDEGKPPDPPPGPGLPLPLVEFKTPPLKYNSGSWDAADFNRRVDWITPHHIRIMLGQKKQPRSRVVRYDFGLQDPAHAPGSGPHLREPKERLRRYELKVKIPADYSGKGELCTLGIKMHTHAPRGHAYIAFIAWTTTVRWRINHPDGGGRKEGGEAPVKRGHTYAMAVEAFWSQGPQGVLRAWTDGKLVVEHKGPNYSKDEDKPPYLLVGAYFPSAIEEFSEVFEFSELRVGDIS